jgi:hypothetical protein
MTPEQKEDWEKTIRESYDLPYPLNYMAFDNQGIAYVVTKMFSMCNKKKW